MESESLGCVLSIQLTEKETSCYDVGLAFNKAYEESVGCKAVSFAYNSLIKIECVGC